MASSRDDFIIAIRSAFLKKQTKQKFSLLSLIFISIFIIILSSLNFKIVSYIKSGINELVYRSSFNYFSFPEKTLKQLFDKIKYHTTFFQEQFKKRFNSI